MTINIGLCGSIYDTILYVYDGATEIGCNDDSSCGLQSELTNVHLAAGHHLRLLPPHGVCGHEPRAECAQSGGVFYLGDGTDCEPDPCAAMPVAARTWGWIKNPG